MTPVEETLRALARASGRALGELGVRPGDEKWIREHAETIAGLVGRPAPRGLRGLFRRLKGRARNRGPRQTRDPDAPSGSPSGRGAS